MPQVGRSEVLLACEERAQVLTLYGAQASCDLAAPVPYLAELVAQTTVQFVQAWFSGPQDECLDDPVAGHGVD
jgi:hypothetical protein